MSSRARHRRHRVIGCPARHARGRRRDATAGDGGGAARRRSASAGRHVRPPSRGAMRHRTSSREPVGASTPHSTAEAVTRSPVRRGPAGRLPGHRSWPPPRRPGPTHTARSGNVSVQPAQGSHSSTKVPATTRRDPDRPHRPTRRTRLPPLRPPIPTRKHRRRGAGQPELLQEFPPGGPPVPRPARPHPLGTVARPAAAVPGRASDERVIPSRPGTESDLDQTAPLVLRPRRHAGSRVRGEGWCCACPRNDRPCTRTSRGGWRTPLRAGDRALRETRSGQPLGGLLPTSVSDESPTCLSRGGISRRGGRGDRGAGAGSR